jgi:hypothetical protein
MEQNKSTSLVILDKAEKTKDLLLKEISDAFFDIPFENSTFQLENFVIAAQMTPERAFRAIGLRLHKKLISVQETLICFKLQEIKDQELLERISKCPAESLKKRRLELEYEKSQISRNFDMKLLNDAITELDVLYKHFKALPKYTREQFEAGEELYFLESLKRQSHNLSGAEISLINMKHDIQGIENFQKNIEKISSQLDNLSLSDLRNLTEESLINTKLAKIEKENMQLQLGDKKE